MVTYLKNELQIKGFEAPIENRWIQWTNMPQHQTEKKLTFPHWKTAKWKLKALDIARRTTTMAPTTLMSV